MSDDEMLKLAITVETLYPEAFGVVETMIAARKDMLSVISFIRTTMTADLSTAVRVYKSIARCGANS
jgi:hypothetical protein